MTGDLDHNELLKTPLPKRNEALRRFGLIEKFERFAAVQKRDGAGRVESMRLFCAAENIAVSTFKRWIKEKRKGGVLALVDNRGGARQQETFSPEAFEELKRLYLDKRQPTLKSCWLTLNYINKMQDRGWSIPSYGAAARYVREIPLPVLVMHRQGQAAYDAKCGPYVQTDFASIEPGQIWISDHHQFNLFLLHNGQWVRPWLTAWQDMRSRAVVGWHVSFSPNSTTILLSLKHGIKLYGPPQTVKIDNGRDYDSRLFTGQTKTQRRAGGDIDESTMAGIFGVLGIKASFAIPYHPQSKAIERFFDTMDVQFVKSFETYCGKDQPRKPEDLADYMKTRTAIENAVGLEQFTEKVVAYMAAYNNTVHSLLKGQTPLEVLHSRGSKRVILDDTLDLLLAVWSEPLKVGKNGVRFKGMYYGQYCAVLAQYQGRFVRVSYDPLDIRRVRVFEAESWKYITTVEQNQLIQYDQPVAEDALRDAMANKNRMRRLHKQAVEGRRTALMSLPDLCLAALADNAQKPQDEKRKTRVSAVRTPLDGQSKLVRRVEKQRTLKKAVGAENELHLDFDLDCKRDDFESINLHLFDD